ncbi:hypothetical protein ACFPFV_11750 [Salinicoccus siamensis]|uniref:hypothetical protein n=1 Tax=Salinicoccus siamensis TaxID=381830 RepID=UPI003613E81A
MIAIAVVIPRNTSQPAQPYPRMVSRKASGEGSSILKLTQSSDAPNTTRAVRDPTERRESRLVCSFSELISFLLSF